MLRSPWCEPARPLPGTKEWWWAFFPFAGVVSHLERGVCERACPRTPVLRRGGSDLRRVVEQPGRGKRMLPRRWSGEGAEPCPGAFGSLLSVFGRVCPKYGRVKKFWG